MHVWDAQLEFGFKVETETGSQGKYWWGGKRMQIWRSEVTWSMLLPSRNSSLALCCLAAIQLPL